MKTLHDINTEAELLEFLTGRLSLDTHTITFHIIDGDYIGGGLIDEEDDLYGSSAFDHLAYKYPDDSRLYISNVITYQIGSGESESATSKEITILEEAMYMSKDMFSDMLYEYADILCDLEDIEIENPAYEEYDD